MSKKSKESDAALTEQQAANEAFARGYHEIPDDNKLKSMTFADLAILLSDCRPGSPKYLVVEREMARRKTMDALPPKHKPSFFSHPISKWLLGILATIITSAILYYLGIRR